MTTKFKQLSLEQRYQINALLKAKLNQTEIATILQVHKSTISRELRRNIPQRGRGAKEYEPEKANKKTQTRHKLKRKQILFTEEMKMLVKQRMEGARLSPELVKKSADLQHEKMVSHETIYSWLWQMKKSHRRKDTKYIGLYKYLKHGKRHRKRGRIRDARGLIPGRVSIEKRPLIVNQRKRIGDIEVDLMMGKNHQSALLVVTDRATIKTSIRKVNGKNSSAIAKKIISIFKTQSHWIKTLTFDNDMAFAKHLHIANKLGVKTFFTRPYTSQDKGTVENRIGVIRMFYPKKTDFNRISYQDVKKVENHINNRPVRKFNYLTPNQLFNKKMRVAFIS